MKEISHFINICLTIAIQILDVHDFFLVDFDGDIQMMFRTLVIFYVCTWVPSYWQAIILGQSKCRQSQSKQRLFLSTVNRTSAACMQNSRGTPISPYWPVDRIILHIFPLHFWFLDHWRSVLDWKHLNHLSEPRYKTTSSSPNIHIEQKINHTCILYLVFINALDLSYSNIPKICKL